MFDELEEQPSNRQNLENYWGIVVRRRWLLILPLFALWALVWAASWFLPAYYKSETLILVEQQKVPEQYVVPNVASDLQDRLQSMTQQITSRTRLARIIEQFNLYPDQRRRLSSEELVDAMRKDIEIELVQAPGRKDDLSAFRVSYTCRDPRVAQEVTNELTSFFIEENLEARREQSETTTGFLENQLEEARQSLSGQEEKVRDFKGQHLGELPTQMQSNVQILQGLQARLQGETEALNQARQQKTYLGSLLTQYRSIHAALQKGDGSAETPPAIDEEIARLKQQLAEVASRYTEKHPDYRKLKEQLAKAEAMKQQIASEVKSKPAQQNNGDLDASELGDSKDMAAMLQIQSQLKANDLEISNRQQQIKNIEAQMEDYQRRINEAPVREQQLADLTRDYDQSRVNYESLLAKKNQSELATNLEKRQQGEQFRILDPASLPQKPYKPDRLLLSCIGLAVGIVVSVGATAAAEVKDDRVYSETDLEGLVTAPVITEIPPLPTPPEESAAKRSLLLQWLGGIAVLLATGAAFVFTYYHG
jgi:polysaccharide chain length determinant protein (PEP-CTERM system associated)